MKEWRDRPRIGDVVLRALRVRDARIWGRTRRHDHLWLEQWEATPPGGSAEPALTFGSYARQLRRQARRGLAYPWVAVYRGEFAGQVTVSSITRGSVLSGVIGYWVASDFAGRGIAPTAVALAVDHAFWRAGLHRIEIAIRPENHASLRVVEKLGLREEGMRPRYIHINGQWADHRVFAVIAEEVPGGLLKRWLENGGQECVAVSGIEPSRG